MKQSFNRKSHFEKILFLQFLMDRVTTLKSKEDESINDENSNEMENNEKQPDISATDEENSHNISNNDTQENHSN